MRDIIWTLIIVWLIYKIVDVFRITSAKRSSKNTTNSTYTSTTSASAHTSSRPEQDIKNAVKQHLNKEGEYVDFEEVK